MIEDTIRFSRDAFYVSVGFGVIVFQKLQVRRREFEKQLATDDRSTLQAAAAPLQQALAPVGRVVSASLGGIDRAVTTVESQVDPVLDGVELALPPATREVVHQAREVAKVARAQVVGLFVAPTEGPTNPNGSRDGS